MSVTDLGLKAIRNARYDALRVTSSVTDLGLKAIRNRHGRRNAANSSVTDLGLKAIRNPLFVLVIVSLKCN